MSEYTKGPWEAVGSIPEEGVDCWWLNGAGGELIGTINGPQDSETGQADAHLIAAARELLDALIDARSAIKSLPADALGEAYRIECAPDAEGRVMTWPIRDELLDKIIRAINKAHGID